MESSSNSTYARVWNRLKRVKILTDKAIFTTIDYGSYPINKIAKITSDIPSKYFKASFFGLILLYTTALLVQAWSYSSDARLFPLLIGIPLIFMIIFNFGLMRSSRYSSEAGGIFDDITDEALSENEEESGRNIKEGVKFRLERELKMMLWIIGATVLAYFIGFLNAFAGFLFAFIYVYERGFIRAAIITILTLVFIRVFFIEILALPLWEGTLFSTMIVARPQLGGGYHE